ncbi:hypothetical protein [Pedobacter cryophilus]|uniref:Uncharacterized protein n=1 Tax=Pedobacter cryophilus TaxID=2571271 RepID=A0A4U1C107_9SPHI|nr:hypothetical protein [Pedobacter cryophilus]TKB98637.1 hypothetical protein FA046_05835 [Pedobacter cryophilus]
MKQKILAMATLWTFLRHKDFEGKRLFEGHKAEGIRRKALGLVLKNWEWFVTQRWPQVSACKAWRLQRFTTYLSQWVKTQNPSTPLRVTSNAVSSSCKGLHFNWNKYFKLSCSASPNNQSTASYSALAIADSPTEVNAESFEANGAMPAGRQVAVALWSLSSYRDLRKACLRAIKNIKTCEKRTSLHGNEWREYHWKTNFQRFTTYLSQWLKTQNPSTLPMKNRDRLLRVTSNTESPSFKGVVFKRFTTKLSQNSTPRGSRNEFGMTAWEVGSSCKGLGFHWNRILNVIEILERGVGKTPSRELACERKDRFTLIFWCLFHLRKKTRASAAIERREYNWKADFQRFTTKVSQYSKTHNPSTPLRVTDNAVSPSFKGLWLKRFIAYLSQYSKPRGSRNEFGMTAREEGSSCKGLWFKRLSAYVSQYSKPRGSRNEFGMTAWEEGLSCKGLVFKRFTTKVSQYSKPRGSRNEFGMTAREEGSSCKGLVFKRFIVYVSQWLVIQNPSSLPMKNRDRLHRVTAWEEGSAFNKSTNHQISNHKNLIIYEN